VSGPLENGEAVATAIGPTLDRFVEASAPYLQKVTDHIYERLLDGVQDYLRENGEWNIGVEIDRCRQIERDCAILELINKRLLETLRTIAGLTVRRQLPLTNEINDLANAAIAKATGA